MASKTKTFLKLCKKYNVEPGNIPEVKSFEEACKILKLSPTNLPSVGRLPKRHQKRIIADYKLTIIAEAIRGGKQVDYTNSDPKYFPYFLVKADDKRPSGFGLSYYYYDIWRSYTDVGVRLCFTNRDQAIYFGKHFLKLHTDHHLMT